MFGIKTALENKLLIVGIIRNTKPRKCLDISFCLIDILSHENAGSRRSKELKGRN